MAKISITSASGAYDVYCERGAISRSKRLISAAAAEKGARCFVLSSPRVWRYWGKPIASALAGQALKTPILFDDSESSKCLWTVEGIARELVRAGQTGTAP